MPDRILDVDLIPTLRKLQKTLDRETPTRQMQTIELLMVSFALRFGDPVKAMTVVHAMHKHALQMVLQHQTPSGDNPPSTNGNMKKDVT
jgi:hypothetical protein